MVSRVHLSGGVAKRVDGELARRLRKNTFRVAMAPSVNIKGVVRTDVPHVFAQRRRRQNDLPFFARPKSGVSTSGNPSGTSVTLAGKRIITNPGSSRHCLGLKIISRMFQEAPPWFPAASPRRQHLSRRVRKVRRSRHRNKGYCFVGAQEQQDPEDIQRDLNDRNDPSGFRTVPLPLQLRRITYKPKNGTGSFL